MFIYFLQISQKEFLAVFAVVRTCISHKICTANIMVEYFVLISASRLLLITNHRQSRWGWLYIMISCFHFSWIYAWYIWINIRSLWDIIPEPESAYCCYNCLTVPHNVVPFFSRVLKLYVKYNGFIQSFKSIRNICVLLFISCEH